MKIAMFTNTYLPMVGGVADSVDIFSTIMREDGHDVRIVSPTYEEAEENEEQVFRILAMENFDGSDFSVVVPLSFELNHWLDDFAPEVIHSHHPFLLGNMAIRYACSRKLPVVFTHHTMYEHYTHYLPVHLEKMKRYVIAMSTGYANFCDAVIAPSESTAEILKQRGVKVPIRVAPTGVNVQEYSEGNGDRCRQELEIPASASLVGTVGRLAPEKNLDFLAQAIARAMQKDPDMWFLVVGSGPSRKTMEEIFTQAQLDKRVCFAGEKRGQDLVDAYHAMDVFAFASKTETQGMVLTEAQAAGCPVVAVDAPGAREAVDDGRNGRLIDEESEDSFAQALCDLLSGEPKEFENLVEQARQTAETFEVHRCTRRVESLYEELLLNPRAGKTEINNEYLQWVDSLRKEWEIWANRLRSAGKALKPK